MKLITAPEKHTKHEEEEYIPQLFLAGSIEMGIADAWQTKLIEELKDDEVIVLNPRRSVWDSSWEQSIHNEKFKEQVEWELDGLDSSDIISMYFDGNTKSPISLLELGLFATSGKLVVYCPKEFWRKGNVEIVCARYSIPCFAEWQPFLEHIKMRIKEALTPINNSVIT